jgi:hypothetical protein
MSGVPRIAGPPPIGVFDSGVGGLSVLRALCEALPAQDFIYLGDTARLPRGRRAQSRAAPSCAASETLGGSVRQRQLLGRHRLPG